MWVAIVCFVVAATPALGVDDVGAAGDPAAGDPAAGDPADDADDDPADDADDDPDDDAADDVDDRAADDVDAEDQVPPPRKVPTLPDDPPPPPPPAPPPPAPPTTPTGDAAMLGAGVGAAGGVVVYGVLIVGAFSGLSAVTGAAGPALATLSLFASSAPAIGAAVGYAIAVGLAGGWWQGPVGGAALGLALSQLQFVAIVFGAIIAIAIVVVGGGAIDERVAIAGGVVVGGAAFVGMAVGGAAGISWLFDSTFPVLAE